MGWFFYLICAVLFLVVGAFMGVIWTERGYRKHSNFMVRYMGLTQNSKRYVDGIMVARESHDERTTYRERK